MKIMVNEETLKMMKDLIPDTKNVFTKLKAATDLINSIKVEINNNLTLAFIFIQIQFR